jgi:hypothetical protein
MSDHKSEGETVSKNKRRNTESRDGEYLKNPSLQNEAIPSIHYEICVQGLLSNQWFECFDSLVFQVVENDQTLIRANLTDKSALHGLLTRIGELNLTVLSVNKIEETFRPNGT